MKNQAASPAPVDPIVICRCGEEADEWCDLCGRETCDDCGCECGPEDDEMYRVWVCEDCFRKAKKWK